MTERDQLVKIANLSKRYGTTTALDDVPLSVDAGEAFGLLGPNGADKTTLMKVVATLTEPTAGQVTVDGIDVTNRQVSFVGLAALIAVAATTFSLFVAYALKYEFAFSVVTSFLVLPVLFVSNAFVTTSVMPAWLGTLADWNPVSIAIAGMRAPVDGWVWADVAPAVGLLVALALGFGIVTAWTFTRTLKSEADLLVAVTPGR